MSVALKDRKDELDTLRSKAKMLIDDSPTLERDQIRKDLILSRIDAVDEVALADLIHRLEAEKDDWERHLANVQPAADLLETTAKTLTTLENKAKKVFLAQDEADEEADMQITREALINNL